MLAAAVLGVAAEWIAVAAGACALAVGFAGFRAARRSRSESRAASERIDALRDELAALDRRLQSKIGVATVEARRAAGSLRIGEHNTVAEAMKLNRDAKAILAAFHIGGCSSCVVDESSTLLHAAMGNNADLPELLAALNGLAPLPAAHDH